MVALLCALVVVVVACMRVREPLVHTEESVGAVKRELPELHAGGVCYVREFLPRDVWRHMRLAAAGAPGVASELGAYRRSTTVPRARLVGTPLERLMYNEAGDHISRHVDVNWYAGRTFTALLTLTNRDAWGQCCSATETCYDRGRREVCTVTEENSLLLFEGDRVADDEVDCRGHSHDAEEYVERAARE